MKTKLLITSAVFGAMITTLTFFPKIPVGFGYIHLGDSMIFLAACILPTPYALISAGIGGALADLIGGYHIWIVPTLIVKALISLPFGSKSEKILTKRNTLMLIPAGMITITGYAAAEIILFNTAAAIAGLSGGLIQVIGSSSVFIVIATALDRINFKQKL